MKCSYCELQEVRRNAFKEGKFVTQLGNSVYAVTHKKEPLAKPGNWVGWFPFGIAEECECDEASAIDEEAFDTTIIEPPHRKYAKKKYRKKS